MVNGRLVYARGASAVIDVSPALEGVALCPCALYSQSPVFEWPSGARAFRHSLARLTSARGRLSRYLSHLTRNEPRHRRVPG